MRARTLRSTLLSALAGALLAACGSGLYDAAGVPQIDGGGGNACNPGQNACGGVCYDNGDLAHCGPACADCTGNTPPAGGQLACLGSGAATACSYTCGDGLLKCASGCCGATAVAAAEGSTCALLSSGEVACWGANGDGQVGDGTASAAQPTPRLVALGSAASAVATGGTHACAVVASGAVACWGANEAGQVTGTPGASLLAPAATPVTTGAVAVAAGASHTCALLSGGAVRCWGASATAPGQPLASGAAAISAGRNHTCAMLSGGAIACWGSNASGQLGAAPSGGIASPATNGAMALLAAGADQTCAATGTTNNQNLDTSLQCWGDSLGAGWGLASPQTAPAIPLKQAGRSTIQYAIERLSAGANFTCVKRAAEGVDCLGANDRGQLGGTLTAAGEKVTVTLPAFPAALASGATHTCAVLPDGRLRCWGGNDAGQLGNASTTDPGLGNIVAPLGQ